mmetsp:Transcript_13102/g.24395  ORF Transcript_13102/g.24395 Transcript_13102/m.24395 type:complete len:749 (-) Transcript_13102:112-2358(-)
MVMMSRTSVYVWCFLSCVACVGHASEVPTCSADSTPWKETIDETEPAIQMLQVKGVSSRLAQFAVVGVNQTSGCTAKFKFQTSALVVNEAIANRSGYHFGDMASDQNILSLAGGVKSLKLSGCCEVTVFTKLNYQGESKVYKQGAHTDIKGPINSVRLTPAVCVSPVWKEWEKMCADMPALSAHKNAQFKAQFDQRKCTMQSFGNGVCRDKNDVNKRPWSCMNDNKPKQKDFGEDFCQKSCMEMRGLAVGLWFRGTSVYKCECFLPGPRDMKKTENKGPQCPCGWKSQPGWPARMASPWKRGDTRAKTGVSASTKCAPISCAGPEPTAPPAPAPPPGFKYFKDCSGPQVSPEEKDEDIFAVGRILKDKRKCTGGPMKFGACRDKHAPKGFLQRHSQAHSCHYYTHKHFKGAELASYKDENCTEACVAMKAIAAQTQWTWDSRQQKRRDGIITHCTCYFAGPKADHKDILRGTTDCPCGWSPMSGYPTSKDKLKLGDRSASRGDLVVVDMKEGNLYNWQGACAIINCDGPDPYDMPTPAPAPPPVPLTAFWKSAPFKTNPNIGGKTCTDTAMGREGLRAMQEMMTSKRKCTAQPLKQGSCKSKNFPGPNKINQWTAHSCYMQPTWLPKAEATAFKTDDCTKLCVAMKAMAAETGYHLARGTKKRLWATQCYCFFPGYRKHTHAKNKGQTVCPCGWISYAGYPKKSPIPVKRGDLVAVPEIGEHADCTIIDCDGDDPPLPATKNTLESWW